MNISTKLFDKYPEDIQSKICGVIEKIIAETFVYTADSDYINARFLSLNFQFRPFFWPALHALEKYLKANLLMYGVPVKDRKFGHKICVMAKELKHHTDVLESLKLRPNGAHIELMSRARWGSDDTSLFLEAIDEFGDPNNRYNYYGSKYEASFLLKLDQVVYALRNNVVGNEILHPLTKNPSLSYFAYEQNYSFAPSDYNHDSVYEKFASGATVPTLEVALKGLYGNAAIYEAWVKEHMLIKDDDIKKIKNIK